MADNDNVVLEEDEEETELRSSLASDEDVDRLNEDSSENSDPEDVVIDDNYAGESDVSDSSPTPGNKFLMKYDGHYLEEEQEQVESTAESEQQVRDGMLAIKKLDRHLKRLAKVELESKRSRLRFEAQMVRELEQLSTDFPNSANNCPAVHANTMKFLAIDMPIQKHKKQSPSQNLPGITAGDMSAEESLSEAATDSENDEEGSDDDVVPVFTTELNDSHFAKNKLEASPRNDKVGNTSSSSEYLTANSSASENPPITENFDKKKNEKKDVPATAGEKNDGTPRRPPKEAFVSNDKSQDGQDSGPAAKPHKKRHGRNFIARNIQLAVDAANDVPMTDDEKKRLSELLADIDEEPDNAESVAATEPDDHALVLKDNDRSVTSRSSIAASLLSEGYKPSENDIGRLSVIDDKLRAITSSQQGSIRFGSRTDTWRDTATVSSTRHLPVAAPSQNSSRFSVLHETRSDALSLIMEDVPDTPRQFDSTNKEQLFGEKALMEVRETRELNTRLDTIDGQLAELTGSHPYPVEVDLPKLHPEEVRSLVSQCVSVLSEQETDDGETSVVTYDDVLASATHLPDSELQDLLNQAKRELGLLSLEAPDPIDYNERKANDSLYRSASLFYDNETWSFLREVEAHLEYPPAFLRSLPDPPSEQGTEQVNNNNCSAAVQPAVVKQEEPIPRTFSGRLSEIRESQELQTPKSTTPTMQPEELVIRSASGGRLKDLQGQGPSSSSPTLPPLSGRRRSHVRHEAGGSAETRKSNSSSSNSQLEKDLSNLRLEGTAFSSSSSHK